MRTPLFALIYFLSVFALGFVLGAVRVIFLEPKLGATGAELIETPFMIMAAYLVARTLVKRLAPGPGKALAAGLLALTILLIAEFSLVLQVRGISFGDYYESRSPLSLSVYAMSLLAFALMPFVVARAGHRNVSRDS